MLLLALTEVLIGDCDPEHREGSVRRSDVLPLKREEARETDPSPCSGSPRSHTRWGGRSFPAPRIRRCTGPFKFLMTISLLLSALISTTTTASAETPPSHGAPTMGAHYTLDLQVDDVGRTVAVRETVEATNHTHVTLTSLVFNVTPRAYGAFQFNSAVVDGKPVAPSFDDVVMDVPLPTPLAAEQSTTVDLQFMLKIPSPGSLRFGLSDGVLTLGNWFPILAVYLPNGWDRHHYSPVGDPFFTETADYTVSLHADPHLVVAHTGVLQSHRGDTWEIQANGVRDFSLAMSRNYEVSQAQVGETTISAYYLPRDKKGGQAMLDYAKQSFAWYEDHLGPYGYPSFDVAETPSQSSTDVGQEYPNLIYVATPYVHQPTAPGYYLTYLVAHETGHQWLYGLVGNDHVRQPWLDEGPVVELSYQFIHDRYPSAYEIQWKQLQIGYQQALATYGSKPVDSTEADFSSNAEYFDLLYRESAIFLDHLRVAMGDTTYYAMWKRYVEMFRGGNATTQDFLLLAEQVAGKDFSELYRQYFRPDSYAPSTPTPIPTALPSPMPTPPPIQTVSATVVIPPHPTAKAASPLVIPTTLVAPTGPPPATATVSRPRIPSTQPTVVREDRAAIATRSLSIALAAIIVISLGGLLLVGLLAFSLLRRR